jgi:uncharacterized protein (DUF1800 family)
MSLEGAIAVHRFGLGARSGDVDAASADPKTWLMRQIDQGADQPEALDGDALRSGGDLVRELIQLRAARNLVKSGASADAKALIAAFRDFQQTFLEEVSARTALGFSTERPFAERLVWFWSNHFTVSVQNGALPLVGAYEREAIRPNINRTFEDMLVAVVCHPAMLLYLNNAQSVGPDSIAGDRTGKGYNENLGRELMELHTLGVDGGYTQADVVALAELLSGWSIDRSGANDGFRFYPARHQPGEILFRGKTYPAGEAGGRAALHELAHDPHTARHVARQLAVHFIGDDPSAESVARLEAIFNRTGGDLCALAQGVVDEDAAWKPGSGKMRAPIEYVTATYRFFGWPRPDGDQEKQVRQALGVMRLMGQFPLSAPSPKGWPDVSEAWSGSDALLNRIEWARLVGNRIPKGFDSVSATEAVLGPLLRSQTKSAMTAAPSPGEAMALMIASPEFQRA